MSESFSNTVDCASIEAGTWPQELRTRAHVFRADVGPDSGGADSAPSPHDYFDSALASCKALTVIWYAKRRGIPLERVATRVDRDDHAQRWELCVQIVDDSLGRRDHATRSMQDQG